MRIVVAAVASAALLASPAAADDPPEPRQGAAHAVPLHGDLVRDYDAPDDPYAAGHRGVDVAADAGSVVRASADGVVSFSGVVAGNRSVTISHDPDVRTTYSFLGSAGVTTGQSVVRGQTIGTVGDGHPSVSGAHVHLSARRGDFYFDPLWLYVGSSHADLLELTA